MCRSTLSSTQTQAKVGVVSSFCFAGFRPLARMRERETNNSVGGGVKGKEGGGVVSRDTMSDKAPAFKYIG